MRNGKITELCAATPTHLSSSEGTECGDYADEGKTMDCLRKSEKCFKRGRVVGWSEKNERERETWFIKLKFSEAL